MRPTLPLRLHDKGKCISDLHRKLSNIREQLHRDSTDSCDQYLRGTISDVFDERMVEAINVFKKRFLPESKADGICDEATWELLSTKAGNVFSEVWQYELDALQLYKAEADQTPPATRPVRTPTDPHIAAVVQDALTVRHNPAPAGRRSTDPVDIVKNRETGEILKVRPANEDDVIANVHAANLAGLAFSGGGIRSATFNLGILQALAERKMLRDFDYLSTVSGGGYIGAWFSA